MTEAEWLNCPNPQQMLKYLGLKASDRKLWLYAVTCCRRSWNQLKHEALRLSIETAESFADRGASEKLEPWLQDSDAGTLRFRCPEIEFDLSNAMNVSGRGNRHASWVTLSQADFLNSGDRITSPTPSRRVYKFGGGIVQSKHYCVQNSPKLKITIAARCQMSNISSPERASAGKANQRFAPFQTARIANPKASGQVMTVRL